MDSNFVLVIGLVAALAVLGAVFLGARKHGGKGAPAAAGLPYVSVNALLTVPERRCYRSLIAAAPGLLVFPKVRMSDVVLVPRSVDGRQAHVNRIMSKHADFVLCETESTKPVLVVELAAGSNSEPDSSLFLQGVFHAAGLAHLRLGSQDADNLEELSARIGSAIMHGRGNQ